MCVDIFEGQQLSELHVREIIEDNSHIDLVIY